MFNFLCFDWGYCRLGWANDSGLNSFFYIGTNNDKQMNAVGCWVLAHEVPDRMIPVKMMMCFFCVIFSLVGQCFCCFLVSICVFKCRLLRCENTGQNGPNLNHPKPTLGWSGFQIPEKNLNPGSDLTFSGLGLEVSSSLLLGVSFRRWGRSRKIQEKKPIFLKPRRPSRSIPKDSSCI